MKVLHSVNKWKWPALLACPHPNPNQFWIPHFETIKLSIDFCFLNDLHTICCYRLKKSKNTVIKKNPKKLGFSFDQLSGAGRKKSLVLFLSAVWVLDCVNFVWFFLLSYVCLSIFVVYVSLFHSLIVLSFSSAAEAMIFSVGWHAVHKTTSVWPCKRCTTSLLCKFQMYTMLSSLPDTIH